MFSRAVRLLRRVASSAGVTPGESRQLLNHVQALQAQTELTYHRTGQLLIQMAAMQREHRLLAGQLTLPEAALWAQGTPPIAGMAGEAVFTHSSACRQEMLETPYYAYWAAQLNQAPRYHRKLWEFVFICQALHERGVIRPGARGLGFGVGGEVLSAYFAGRGCQILGTDLAVESAVDTGWMETAQHAAGKEQLRYDQLCPFDVFDANVQFRPCDMNAIPADLQDFDFCWSACALEHLGSIDKGLTFIERSIDCLKPGGWAVHTTELNVSSNGDTIDNAGTVLFRRCDFEAFAARLTAAGHHVAPLDFNTGDKPMDQYVDLPPFRTEPHLKLAIEGYVTTSFGLIVQKAF